MDMAQPLSVMQAMMMFALLSMLSMMQAYPSSRSAQAQHGHQNGVSAPMMTSKICMDELSDSGMPRSKVLMNARDRPVPIRMGLPKKPPAAT